MARALPSQTAQCHCSGVVQGGWLIWLVALVAGRTFFPFFLHQWNHSTTNDDNKMIDGNVIVFVVNSLESYFFSGWKMVLWVEHISQMIWMKGTVILKKLFFILFNCIRTNESRSVSFVVGAGCWCCYDFALLSSTHSLSLVLLMVLRWVPYIFVRRLRGSGMMGVRAERDFSQREMKWTIKVFVFIFLLLHRMKWSESVLNGRLLITSTSSTTTTNQWNVKLPQNRPYFRINWYRNDKLALADRCAVNLLNIDSDSGYHSPVRNHNNYIQYLHMLRLLLLATCINSHLSRYIRVAFHSFRNQSDTIHRRLTVHARRRSNTKQRITFCYAGLAAIVLNPIIVMMIELYLKEDFRISVFIFTSRSVRFTSFWFLIAFYLVSSPSLHFYCLFCYLHVLSSS